MSKAAAIVIPAALFAAAIWGIVHGIGLMVSKENNNKFHAMLLGCTYMGRMEKMDEVLIFDCADKIELHKEINWKQSSGGTRSPV
jgi:hypothetical protein